MKNLKKYELILNIQIAIAFVISIFLSKHLGLQNYVTAGVVTLLSIQSTRKKTIITAAKRALGYILMLILVVIIFNGLGFTLFAFGLFVLLFSILNSRLDISIGLAPNVVMASHFFLEKTTDFPFIINETFIYIIGLSMAIIVNLLIPIINNNDVKKKENLDNSVKNLLMFISNLLNEKYLLDSNRDDKQLYRIYISKQIKDTKRFIDEYENDIKNDLENSLFSNDFYNLEYLQLRKRQYNMLEDIFEQSERLDKKLSHTQKISEFIEEIYLNYDEDNTAIGLIEKGNSLLKYFKDLQLPESRSEFENRAVLFVILEDLIEFLKEKYKFTR